MKNLSYPIKKSDGIDRLVGVELEFTSLMLKPATEIICNFLNSENANFLHDNLAVISSEHGDFKVFVDFERLLKLSQDVKNHRKNDFPGQVQEFAKKVLEFTKGEGVPAVYDGVGKKTLEGSIKCLKKRGIMISFGNASGPITNIDIKKMIQPKGLYFTRPSMAQYLETKDEIKEGADKLFEKLKLGKIKIEIYKKYRLDEVVEAHKDLESRKITGPAVIVP